MKLQSVRLEGFGKLADREFTFDPVFNVVVGGNEAGKSTLSSAVLALLYGLGRGEKERWRPWNGARYSARLVYTLGDGRTLEVQRDFERDVKGVRIYDEHGNDASAECAVGKTVCPGEAHLGLPLEVFTNASFAPQGSVSIDGFRAERISHSLARALDGGPREDAALGALGRLDDAIAEYVGRKRATVNAPLRNLREEIGEAQTEADAMRERLRALDDLRARLDTERTRSSLLDAALRRHETHGLSLRSHALRSRLEALRELRDDLAALSAERGQYADVEEFPVGSVVRLERHYQAWHTGEALARSQSEEAEHGRMTPALETELEERNADGGALDDAAFAALEEAAADGTTARDRATAAADRAQNARRNVEGGGELFGALLTIAGLATLGAGILGIMSQPTIAIPVAAFALVLLLFAAFRWSHRRTSQRTVAVMQSEADAAIANEREAAQRVASVLGPLRAASVDDLRRKRDRALELRERKAEAKRLAERAASTRAAADAAAAAFDELAARIAVPAGTPSAPLTRGRVLDAAKEREARKRTRDGIDVRLSMLDVRRGDILGSDDEFALEAELDELTAAGVEPHPPAQGSSVRAFEAERTDLQRRAGDAERSVASLGAELAASEALIGDLAALDERTATLRAKAQVLERFEGAVELARSTIDTRTKEAHQKFARRLSDYASSSFADVTGSRYVDVRVDPTTLAVRVRVPENDAIVDVDLLSAGTREQAYLVTRLAMARMFSEGLEAAPLLLDDPFAYWDEARIERSLPILENFARNGAQLTIFTTSDQLARAAAGRGARVIGLDAAPPRASSPAVRKLSTN